MDVPDSTGRTDSVVITHPSPEVALVTMSRPDRLNAMDTTLVEGLYAAFDEIEADGDVPGGRSSPAPDGASAPDSTSPATDHRRVRSARPEPSGAWPCRSASPA